MTNFHFPENRIVRRFLWLLGVLTIGALGSGLWEIAFRPLGAKTLNATLSLIGQIFHSFQDQTYQQIALDNGQSSSLMLLHFLSFAIVGALAVSLPVVIYDHKKSKREIEKLTTDVEREITSLAALNHQSVAEASIPKKTREELLLDFEKSRDQLRSWAFTKLPGLTLTLILTIISALAIITLIMYSSEAYTNQATAHYHQMMQIVSPYLSSEERMGLASKFAQIQNRSDYIDLIKKLEDIADVHKAVKPKFVPW